MNILYAYHRRVAVTLAALLFCTPTNVFAERTRNIIIMIPDGMGLANVTAARIFKNGINGQPLSFETLKTIGYQRSHSADSTVTDSAAAASAWSCGEKFNNGEICHHGNGRPSLPSIMELAKKAGKGTGLVATAAVTDATPAAFGARVPSRDCRQEIARQYVAVNSIDVLLGGGGRDFTAEHPDPCGARGDLMEVARTKGYAVVHDRQSLTDAVTQNSRKLLGLFSERDLTPEYRRTAATAEPRLAEMTAAALALLEKDPDGFFLMVEGSLVDRANHQNNYPYQLGEVLAFEEAVTAVRAWLNAVPDRAGATLLIIVADHETGGFAVTGPTSALPAPGTAVETAWISNAHTAIDTLVWSEGPGSEKLGRAMDNTDLYRVMAESLR
jgi:alkaline phosphatase